MSLCQTTLLPEINIALRLLIFGKFPWTQIVVILDIIGVPYYARVNKYLGRVITFFLISEFSYKLIRFLLNSSVVKSDYEIGKFSQADSALVS